MSCRTAEALAEAPIVLVGTVEAQQLDHFYDGVVVVNGYRRVRVRVEEILRGEVEGDTVDLRRAAVYGERVLITGEPAEVGGRTLTDVLVPGRWAIFSRGADGELLGQLDVSFPLQCLGPDGWAHIQGSAHRMWCPETHDLGFDGFLGQVRAAAAMLPPSATTIQAPQGGLMPDQMSSFDLGGIRFEGLEPSSLKPAVWVDVDALPAQVDAPPPWVPRPADQAVPSIRARQAYDELKARQFRHAEPGTFLSAKTAIESAGSQPTVSVTYQDARQALALERKGWPLQELLELGVAVELYRRHACAERAYKLAGWLLEAS